MTDVNFSIKNGLVVNGAFTANSTVVNAAAINATSIAIGANVVVNSTSYFVGNSSVNTNITTGNIALSGVDVATAITGNAATAFANAIANAASNAAALYQTTAGLSANVLTMTANAAGFLGNAYGTQANISSWVTTNAAAAYSNAVANAAALYQTTAGLSANVATLTANAAGFLGNAYGTQANISSWVTGNAATAYTNATTFASNASNITTGTLPYAQLGAAVVNTSGNFTVAGNLNLTGTNNYFGSGYYVGTISATSNGIKANTSGWTFGNSSVNVTINATAFSGIANNANNLGGVAAASYVNTSGAYTISGIHTHNANIVLSAGLSANGTYGTNGQVLTSNGTVAYWGNTGSSYSTGDILTTARNPGAGWLSLNADQVISQATYANLYTTYGQTFVPGSASISTSYPASPYPLIPFAVLNGYYVGTTGSPSTLLVSNNFIGIDYVSPFVVNTTAYAIYDAAYGNSTYIITGNAGIIYYSSNALSNSWTGVNTGIGSTVTLSSIAYGNGIFVAAGNTANIIYSTNNGVNWTQITGSLSASANAFVVYSNGYFYVGSRNVTNSAIYRLPANASIATVATANTLTGNNRIQSYGAGPNGQVVFLANNTVDNNILVLGGNNGTVTSVNTNIQGNPGIPSIPSLSTRITYDSARANYLVNLGSANVVCYCPANSIASFGSTNFYPGYRSIYSIVYNPVTDIVSLTATGGGLIGSGFSSNLINGFSNTYNNWFTVANTFTKSIGNTTQVVLAPLYSGLNTGNSAGLVFSGSPGSYVPTIVVSNAAFGSSVSNSTFVGYLGPSFVDYTYYANNTYLAAFVGNTSSPGLSISYSNTGANNSWSLATVPSSAQGSITNSKIYNLGTGGNSYVVPIIESGNGAAILSGNGSSFSITGRLGAGAATGAPSLVAYSPSALVFRSPNANYYATVTNNGSTTTTGLTDPSVLISNNYAGNLVSYSNTANLFVVMYQPPSVFYVGNTVTVPLGGGGWVSATTPDFVTYTIGSPITDTNVQGNPSSALFPSLINAGIVSNYDAGGNAAPVTIYPIGTQYVQNTFVTTFFANSSSTSNNIYATFYSRSGLKWNLANSSVVITNTTPKTAWNRNFTANLNTSNSIVYSTVYNSTSNTISLTVNTAFDITTNFFIGKMQSPYDTITNYIKT